MKYIIISNSEGFVVFTTREIIKKLEINQHFLIRFSLRNKQKKNSHWPLPIEFAKGKKFREVKYPDSMRKNRTP